MKTLFALVIALFVLSSPLGSQTDPSTLPRLEQSGLTYLGGFRGPVTAISGGGLEYGGSPIAFNPANNSLFVGSDNKIAEISIPAPVNSADPKSMPAATYLQPAFVDPTEGHLRDVYAGSDGIYLYGLLVYGTRLHGAASIYYDASNSQRLSHFARSLSLTTPSFSGWSQVWQADRQGFVSGMMALVPAEWQSKLGGPAIAAQCCIPIVSRTSYGPSAFAFNPALVGQATVPAQPLLYYDQNHRTLGPWEGQNETYGMTTRVGGVALIAGTRTALFFGSNGLGPACYGSGTADKALADASLTDNICYDPTDPNQGNHAYPYRYQIWAYDLTDFAAVKDGTKQPWDVLPYGVWPLEFPTPATKLVIGGVAYDAQRQIVYVSQKDANRGDFSTGPLFHPFKVNATAPTPTPTPDPVPTPVPSEPTLDELKALVVTLQSQVADLSAKYAIAQADLQTAQTSLTSTTAARDAALTRIAAMKAEAKMILDRNATLKPNSRLPNWATDALNRILTK